MTLRLIDPIQAVKEKFLRMAMVGWAKSYKTWVAATADNPFFCSGGDNGWSSAIPNLKGRDIPSPWFVEIMETGAGNPKAWDEFLGVIDCFIEGKPFGPEEAIIPERYETFVVDHWTLFGRYAYNKGVAQAKLPTNLSKQSGAINEYFKYEYYLDQYLEMTYKLGILGQKMNIVMIFQMGEGKKRNKAGQVVDSWPRPDIIGQASEAEIPLGTR